MKEPGETMENFLLGLKIWLKQQLLQVTSSELEKQ